MRLFFALLAGLSCAAALAAESQDSKASPGKYVAPPPESQTPEGALAELKPTQGNKAQGSLALNSDRSGVRIAGTIEGLTPNAQHGFHIHEKGDCSAPDASSAGDHFNPTKQPHGNPQSRSRHLGDMLNLRANAEGIAQVDFFVDGAKLHTSDPTALVGKAIVVHQKPDDYKSQPSGDSGDRIACGVIGTR